MLVSTKGRYALRMVIALAELQEANGNRPVSLKDIAKAENISMKYLEQLARSLTSENIIKSSRGKFGGYSLARPADDILAGEVIRAAEGTAAPVSCLDANSQPCPRENVCSTIAFWHGLDEVIENYIDNVHLSDLL